MHFVTYELGPNANKNNGDWTQNNSTWILLSLAFFESVKFEIAKNSQDLYCGKLRKEF